MDLMEICLKVRGTETRFLPAMINLPSSSAGGVMIWVDPSFNEDYHIGVIVGVHGTPNIALTKTNTKIDALFKKKKQLVTGRDNTLKTTLHQTQSYFPSHHLTHLL